MGFIMQLQQTKLPCVVNGIAAQESVRGYLVKLSIRQTAPSLLMPINEGIRGEMLILIR